MGKQRDPWAEIFRSALASQVRQPQGEGWLTAKEFIEKCPVGTSKALQVLRDGVRRGIIERFDGSQMSATGRGAKQSWYRPKT